MTGTWLTRVLRNSLHEDTFDLFVAPAIADLQHSRTLAAYAVVWTSLVGALSQDLASDIEHVMNDLTLMLGLVAMQVCYYGGMMLLLVAHVRADEALHRLVNGGGTQVTVTVIGVVLASSVPTLICFWPPRRTLGA